MWPVAPVGWAADPPTAGFAAGVAGLTEGLAGVVPASAANVNPVASNPRAEVRTMVVQRIIGIFPFTTYCTSLTLSSTKITFMFLYT